VITIFYDGFETGFYDQDGIPELTIPVDWHLAWVGGDYSRPEADEKLNKPEHHSGVNAVSIQTTNGHKHKAVLYRRFAVEPGKIYRASVWAMGLTHTAGDSGAGMRVGIDPFGLVVGWQEDGAEDWGQWYDQYHKNPDDPIPWIDGKWVQLSCTAKAESDWITVFLWTSCDYKRGAMAHFDDFLLEVEGDPDQPQPQPDDTIVEQLRRIADAQEAMAAQRTTGLFSRIFGM